MTSLKAFYSDTLSVPVTGTTPPSFTTQPTQWIPVPTPTSYGVYQPHDGYTDRFSELVKRVEELERIVKASESRRELTEF